MRKQHFSKLIASLVVGLLAPTLYASNLKQFLKSVQYLGLTASTYTGALGGVLGANAKCQITYPESHACSYSELVSSGATSLATTAWVIDGATSQDYNYWDGTTYYYGTTMKTLDGNDSYGVGNDWGCALGPYNLSVQCSGWGSGAADDTTCNGITARRGSYMNSTGSLALGACSTARNIPCCR
jgi:hypothetical protein